MAQLATTELTDVQYAVLRREFAALNNWLQARRHQLLLADYYDQRAEFEHLGKLYGIDFSDLLEQLSQLCDDESKFVLFSPPEASNALYDRRERLHRVLLKRLSKAKIVRGILPMARRRLDNMQMDYDSVRQRLLANTEFVSCALEGIARHIDRSETDLASSALEGLIVFAQHRGSSFFGESAG